MFNPPAAFAVSAAVSFISTDLSLAKPSHHQAPQRKPSKPKR